MNLNDLKESLTLADAEYASLPPHVRAFCLFLIPSERHRFGDIISQYKQLGDLERTYDFVAAMGYAFASGCGTPDEIAQFIGDTERLGGRRFFNTGRTPRFEIDGLALLGVALGLRCAGPHDHGANWLSELLVQSEAAVQGDEWQVSLMAAAAATLGSSVWEKVPSPVMSVAIPHSLGIEVNPIDRTRAWPEVVSLSSNNDIAKTAACRAVFECCASVLASIPVHGATVGELVQLLEGVERSTRRWTYETEKPSAGRGVPRQWHIDHEIHVQNLLWLILAPVFPDLIDEEHLPSVGHRSPRYDLGIPSLRTIVEVKFLRKRGASACSKLTEEIAADVSLYLRSGQGYDTIIPFIWDGCRQAEEYPRLKAGLESLEGVRKVVILSRPAKMDAAPPE
ncbi:MAG TPA: hypothetical protein VHU23_16330 [Rhizomicrobium sp.]|jgi:hypothetical protein|nr:hypothetical protein [Rhizomicrobium sp.]